MSESTMGQVKGSDLISRQKVLNIIDWVHYRHCFSPSEERIFDYLKGVIAECEASTTAPVKHGKWIYEQHFRWGGYRCSECGTLRQHKKGMNYCPSCGARMERSEE